MNLVQHPLTLSLSKRPRGARPKPEPQRGAFGRLRLSGGWVLSAAALTLSSTAHAGPKPKPGFEATLPAPPPAPKVADGAIFNEIGRAHV